MQTVSVPAARTVSRRSASGAACGSSNASARPGTANQTESPVSQSETGAPAAAAVAATVKAWEQRSGASLPLVHFTTSGRTGGAAGDVVMPPSCGTVRRVEATFLAVLVVALLAIAGLSAFAVRRLLVRR